jgi:AraC-like DNA-binding protein
MDLVTSRRVIRVDAHDDGLNRWELTRLRPAPALRPAVGSYSDYWEVTDGFTTRREMPGIEPVLIVNLGDPVEIVAGDGQSIIVGTGHGLAGATHTRSAMSRSSGTQRGVHIHLPLLTMKRLFGLPLHELADRAVPLEAFGKWARSLTQELVEAPTPCARAAVLDRSLTQKLADVPAADGAIEEALIILAQRPGVRVEALARHLGWSRKRMSLQVREATGVGPRLFRRLARFSKLVARLQRRDQAPSVQLALDCGWFDQPHMLHDFKEFAGLTPREFLARSMPNIGGIVES